jgi:hypothetical protein
MESMFQVAGVSMSYVKETLDKGCIERTNHWLYFQRTLNCRYLFLATLLGSRQIYIGFPLLVLPKVQDTLFPGSHAQAHGPLLFLTLLSTFKNTKVCSGPCNLFLVYALGYPYNWPVRQALVSPSFR